MIEWLFFPEDRNSPEAKVLGVGLLFIILGFVPTMWQSRNVRRLWWCLVVLASIFMFMEVYSYISLSHLLVDIVIWLLELLVAVSLCVGFLAFVRLGVKWSKFVEKSFGVVAVATASLVAVVIFIALNVLAFNAAIAELSAIPLHLFGGVQEQGWPERLFDFLFVLG